MKGRADDQIAKMAASGYCTMAEAATMLGVGRQSVRNRCLAGALRSVNIGRYHYVLTADIARSVGPAAAKALGLGKSFPNRRPSPQQ